MFSRFGRPRAATGADVTLTAETMLSLPWRDHDKAMFGSWERQYQEQNGTPAKSDKPSRESKVWRQENLFKLPDASPKLMWRLMRLYRDICALCQNERGVCFASNQYFARNYSRGHQNSRTADGTFAPASEATVRRWISILVEHGWIGSEVCGPDRTLWPLIHPSTLVKVESLKSLTKDFFERHFKRLLTATLNTLTPSLPIVNLDKGSTKNKVQRQATYLKNEPKSVALSEKQQEVVAAIASQFGVDSDWSSAFVQKSDKAVQALWDALDITRLAQSQNKLKFNAAGYLRNWAEGLLSGKRTLPGAVVAMREVELVARQKAAQDEETLAAAAQAKAARDAEKAAAKAARQNAEQESQKAALEAENARFDTLAAPSLVEAWKGIMAQLNPDLNQDSPVNTPTFQTHIRKLIPARIEGNSITLLAPSTWSVAALTRRVGLLNEAWSKALDRSVFVTIAQAP